MIGGAFVIAAVLGAFIFGYGLGRADGWSEIQEPDDERE